MPFILIIFVHFDFALIFRMFVLFALPAIFFPFRWCCALQEFLWEYLNRILSCASFSFQVYSIRLADENYSSGWLIDNEAEKTFKEMADQKWDASEKPGCKWNVCILSNNRIRMAESCNKTGRWATSEPESDTPLHQSKDVRPEIIQTIRGKWNIILTGWIAANRKETESERELNCSDYMLRISTTTIFHTICRAQRCLDSQSENISNWNERMNVWNKNGKSRAIVGQIE